MTLDCRKNLMRYAEEAAYSSKGHFKSADWIKMSLKLYICVPILLSIIIIVFVDMAKRLSSLFSCISLVFSVLALTSPLVNNQEQANKTIKNHMALGNEYLTLYKEMRNISTQNQITNEQVEKIYKKLKLVDNRTDVLQISIMGRFLSKFKINKEMDLDWIQK
jgi:hypothetical protein